MGGKPVSTNFFAYTPGLKIKYATTITKERKLSLAGQVIVKNGEEVSFDDIIAVTQIPGDVFTIHISHKLGVSPGGITSFMLKELGDQVKEGEIIGNYRTLFGLINREVKSPVKGIIETFSEYGSVGIRTAPIPIELRAYLSGKVVEVIQNEGAILETRGSFIQRARAKRICLIILKYPRLRAIDRARDYKM